MALNLIDTCQYHPPKNSTDNSSFKIHAIFPTPREIFFHPKYTPYSSKSLIFIGFS